MTHPPVRFRKPLVAVYDNAMPPAYVESLGKALFYQRMNFDLLADEYGTAYRYHRWTAYEQAEEAAAGELRKRVLELVPSSLHTLGVPAFEPQVVNIEACLHHHQCFTGWTQAAFDDAGALVENRLLGFQYTLHTDPRMYAGGELELNDGTTVDAANNRLVIYHAAQIMKVRTVECWSAHALHGRWSLCGYVYGAVDGWLDSIKSMLLPSPAPLDADDDGA